MEMTLFPSVYAHVNHFVMLYFSYLVLVKLNVFFFDDHFFGFAKLTKKLELTVDREQLHTKFIEISIVYHYWSASTVCLAYG